MGTYLYYVIKEWQRLWNLRTHHLYVIKSSKWKKHHHHLPTNCNQWSSLINNMEQKRFVFGLVRKKKEKFLFSLTTSKSPPLSSKLNNKTFKTRLVKLLLKEKKKHIWLRTEKTTSCQQKNNNKTNTFPFVLFSKKSFGLRNRQKLLQKGKKRRPTFCSLASCWTRSFFVFFETQWQNNSFFFFLFERKCSLKRKENNKSFILVIKRHHYNFFADHHPTMRSKA